VEGWAGGQYENQHVTLLTDIRTVFDRFKRERLSTKAELIPALAGLEDSLWGEWTGVDGTATPHVLSQGAIGRLLRPFGIRSKTVWPPGRRQHTKCTHSTVDRPPAPTPARRPLRLPWNCPDVMPERVGAVVTIIVASGAGKGTKLPNRE
jgi:hypothetical protein